MERDFKGIWIPKEIWLSKELTIMEKLFLVEIDSLDNEEGCFCSNNYFAEFFSLSKNRCSEIIKTLEEKQFITIKYQREKNKKNIEKRVIRVFGKPKGGIRKTEGGYSEKCEDNNTVFNNTFIYIPHQEIIAYLNQKANTEYKYTSKKTKDLIKARFNEGFTLEDFKIVIDKKVNGWAGTKWEQYLRPETLFGNKFEGYLNEKVVQAKETKTTNKFNNFQQDKPDYNELLRQAREGRTANG